MGQTIYVDDDGKGNFTSIQQAIDSANSGDKIFVYEGTYYETIDINKKITLEGESKETTIIHGESSNKIISITSSEVRLTGFTFRCNRSNYCSAGISIESDNNEIIDNNVRLYSGTAIMIEHSKGNLISRNEIMIKTTGIYLSNSDNNIIESNDLEECRIRITSSNDNELIDNEISDVNDGIEIINSEDIRLSGNNLHDAGLYLNGIVKSQWTSHDIDLTNKINAKAIYYLKNENSKVISEDAGCVILADCSKIRIEHLNIHNLPMGILLGYSSGNYIISNNVSDCKYGISLYYSDDNNISHNTLSSNINQGIYLRYSKGNLIYENYILSNQYGIRLSDSPETEILKNSISRNLREGISVSHSNSNRITYNTLYENTGGIIISYYSDDNIVDGNNISYHDNSGISISWSINTVVYNNTILSSKVNGISVSNSGYNCISNNTLSYNKNAIYLEGSSNIEIIGNNMIYGGIFIWGEASRYWDSFDIDSSNTVNGKPVIYLKNQKGGSVLERAGQVILADCHFITVEKQNIVNASAGILLGFCSNNTICDNVVSSNSFGGISLFESENNEILDNIGIKNNDGIYIGYSKYNEIINNLMSLNTNGIHLVVSNENLMRSNIIMENEFGFYLYNSYYNRIFYNNILSNNNQVKCLCYNPFWGGGNLNNNWDDGYPSGGNFWSDYKGVDAYSGENQDKSGADGLGDIPYEIDRDKDDRYPLLEFLDHQPPIIGLLSPQNNSIVRSPDKMIFIVEDIELDTVSYSINHEDTFYFSSVYELDISDWEEGLHHIRIRAEDIARNINQKWFQIIIDTKVPQVTSTIPKEDRERVSTDSQIIIKFSEPMDVDSVESAISISPFREFTCFWSNNNKTMAINFSESLDQGKSYKIKISSDAKDMAGTNIAESYEFEFHTEQDFPILIIVILIIIIIIIVAYVLVKRRKPDFESESLPIDVTVLKQVTCPFCNSVIQVKDTGSTMNFACPHCTRELTVHLGEELPHFQSPQNLQQPTIIACPGCKNAFSVRKSPDPLPIQCPFCGVKGLMR